MSFVSPIPKVLKGILKQVVNIQDLSTSLSLILPYNIRTNLKIDVLIVILNTNG